MITYSCQTVPQHSGFICNLFTYQPLCVAARSRVGLANMARQQVLAVASAGAVVCSSVSETSTIINPAHTSHSMLAHSTPVCYSGPNSRPASGSGTIQHIHDSSRLMTTPSQ